MPNIKSAAKRVKVAEVRRMRNMAAKSRIKTATRKYKEAVEAGNKELAQPLLKDLISLLDKAAGKKLIHKNAAARKKSKLQKAFNAMA
ncbi:MAG TPA: 30S ribosomal protein S20 [Firmicutes bacterium]|nr:30S ribosomal protein S20 [Bacillota bacterium]